MRGKVAGRDYRRFWAAEAAVGLGSYVRLLALQVLVVVSLHGTALDVGLLSAARFLPYLVLGLVAGTWVDRVPRRSVLVWTDLAMVAVWLTLGLSARVGRLEVAGVLALTLLGGSASLFHEAAAQSILPDLVEPRDLLAANVRLEQTGAATQSAGPALAGAIIAGVGAPLAIVMDAVGHAVSAALNAGISHRPGAQPSRRARFRVDVRDGLRWLYGHPLLRTLALNTNLWFVFHAVASTLLVPFLLLRIGLNAGAIGVVLAAAGVGAIGGTVLSPRWAGRFGAGRTIGLARSLYLPSIVLLLLAPPASPTVSLAAVAMVVASELVYGIAMGLEGPLEMAYRQSITPRHLQGRINTTMRASNRAMMVVAAPLGGALAVAVGYRPVLWAAAIGMGLVAVWYAFSPMAAARLTTDGDGLGPGPS